MSDRTDMRVWVYDCPPAERAAALAALDGLTTEFMTGQPEDELDLDEPYYTSEALPGESADIAGALSTAAPGASFLVREYSTCGNPALLCARTPALGLFSGECDTAGQVVLDRDALHGLARGHAGLLLAAADLATGGPWLEDFAAHGPGSRS